MWDVLFTEGGTRSVFQLRVALALLKITEPILLKKNSFEGILEVFKVALQSMWNSQQARSSFGNHACKCDFVGSCWRSVPLATRAASARRLTEGAYVS